MKRYILSSLCVILALCFLIKHPSSIYASEEKITLRIDKLPLPGQTSVQSKIGRIIIKEFSKKYPQYILKPFHFATPSGGNDQGSLMAIASGLPPHGIYVNFRQSSTYIDHKFLSPIEILLARVLSDNPAVREVTVDNEWKENPTKEEIKKALLVLKSEIISSVWPVTYRASPTITDEASKQKHVWFLPFNSLVRTLIYRKDLFQHAGLDPQVPPKTWDEYIYYCRKIMAIKRCYGTVINRGGSVSWGAYSFMVSNGVKYIDRGKDGMWRASLNTNAAAESIYFILRLCSEKFKVGENNEIYTRDMKDYKSIKGRELTGCAYAPLGGGDTTRMWDMGQIGMKDTYLNFRNIKFDPSLTAVAPVPKSPTGKGAGEINAASMGVFAGSPKEVQLGVMRYLWFRNSRAMKKKFVDVMVNNGFGKFLNHKILADFGYDDIVKTIPESLKKTVDYSFKNGVPEPYGKNTQQIYHKVSIPINWALNRPELLELPKENAIAKIKAQLDIAAARIDTFMLKQLTPKQQKKRDFWSKIMLLILLGIFTASFMWAWRHFKKQEKLMGLQEVRYSKFYKA